jgi:hypothetical protein
MHKARLIVALLAMAAGLAIASAADGRIKMVARSYAPVAQNVRARGRELPHQVFGGWKYQVASISVYTLLGGPWLVRIRPVPGTRSGSEGNQRAARDSFPFLSDATRLSVGRVCAVSGSAPMECSPWLR